MADAANSAIRASPASGWRRFFGTNPSSFTGNGAPIPARWPSGQRPTERGDPLRCGAPQMQLTVRQVSEFLNVAESTVTRWIRQRGLPAHHVGGQYRFHRAEVLEWATANRIPVALEMFDHLEPDDEPPPNLADALQAGGIYYQLPDTTKDKALRSLVGVLPLPDGIDREFLLRLLL